ncbi:Zn(II)2Cys6 transcription factor domain-containing protein [Aspergillus ibericus CBS 121593]|uniref:Zn(2)-C6 fungal-type domain-containing protein n=1 Tax=Aspergillus ibericus CBS 121593 TaxID=1448316 RepID=A0A395GRF0_9EURO|nr:hypothetical protein BO80DRAFT_447736 [Aspergillus ibericus CBS 121593]RAK98125.1 hypothetical protein BO80DRAFT_447736 [Aspergillus ibericus CBS 121593]
MNNASFEDHNIPYPPVSPSLRKTAHVTRRIERQACDRCHGHKVRCTRSPNGYGPCIRCQRANAACVHSFPVLRSYPSPRGAPPVASRPHNHVRTSPQVPQISPQLQHQPHSQHTSSHEGQLLTPSTDPGYWPSFPPGLPTSVDNDVGTGSASFKPYSYPFPFHHPQQTAETGRGTAMPDILLEPTNQGVERDRFDNPFLFSSDEHLDQSQIPFLPSHAEWPDSESNNTSPSQSSVPDLLGHSSPLPQNSPMETVSQGMPRGRNDDTPNGSGEMEQLNHHASVDECMRRLFDLHLSLCQMQNCSEARSDEIKTNQVIKASQALAVIMHGLYIHAHNSLSERSSSSGEGATALAVISCYIHLLRVYIDFVKALQQHSRAESAQGMVRGPHLMMPPSNSELDLVLKAQLLSHLLDRVSRYVRMYLSLYVSRGEQQQGSGGGEGGYIRIVEPVELLLVTLEEQEQRLRQDLSCLGRQTFEMGFGVGDHRTQARMK